MNTLELKPCPFCGCEDIYMRANYSSKARRYFVFAQCDVCKSTSGTHCAEYNKFDESIWDSAAAKSAERAWNRRAY